MAEPQVEAAWRAEFKRSGRHNSAKRPIAAVAPPMNCRSRQRFVGQVMKPKRGGSSRRKLTTMLGGLCWSPSLL